MKKLDLVKALSSGLGRTQKETEEILDGLCSTCVDLLVEGENFTLPGIGTFAVETKPERQGFNPATKAAITIPERRVVNFKLSSTVKNAVR